MSRAGTLNSFYGKKHTKETIEKIKAKRALQVIHHSEETKRKMSLAKMGQKPSKKCIDALIKSRAGKKMPEDVRLKISKSMKGKRPESAIITNAKNRALGIPNPLLGRKQTQGWWKWRKNYKPSEETKEKQSRAMLEGFNSGRLTPTFKKGRKPTEIERRRIIESIPRGDKCHFWKGGITPTYEFRRRNLIKTNGGHHSIGEWMNLKAQYNWTCLHCKQCEPTIKLTKDHIIPVSKGGSNNIENIQPLCQPCNSRKYDKIISI